MKTKETLLAILFIFALLVSCDNDDTYQFPNASNDYFPLHIGDTWEYKNHIRKVSVATTINNKEYVLITSDIFRADTLYDSREEFYRKENGKVYKLYTDQSDEFLFVDFTLAEGETWKYKMQNMGDDQWNVTVQPKICFDFGQLVLDNCKPFYYDVPGWADEEQVYVFAPGIGEINNYSPAWGGSDTIQKAQINGITYQFK
jgi:hypothetical protein